MIDFLIEHYSAGSIIGSVIIVVFQTIKLLIKSEYKRCQQVKELKRLLKNEQETTKRLQGYLGKAIEFNAEWKIEDAERSGREVK